MQTNPGNPAEATPPPEADTLPSESSPEGPEAGKGAGEGSGGAAPQPEGERDAGRSR